MDGNRNLKSATAQNTIEHLSMIFARFGLSKVLVSDNGTCFTSSGFLALTSRNGIKHLRIAPYYHSSNGQAERAVQTFKPGMKKQSAGTLQPKLSRFLFHYRLMSHATTGVSPAELLLNWPFGFRCAKSERSGTTATTEAENSTRQKVH